MTRKVAKYYGASLGAVLWLLSGCMGSTGAEMAGPLNHCVSDLDCASDNGRCDLDLGACVSSAAPSTGSVVLHVTDPQLGTTTEQEVDLPDSDSLQPWNIAVSDPILVRGLIEHDEDDGVVAAWLTFRRVSEVTEGVEAPIYVEASRDVEADDDGREFNYQVRLLPGDYELDLEPSAAATNPSEQETHPIHLRVSIDSSTAEEGLALTVPLESRRISSVVVGADGTPLGGVRVFAFSEETGLRVSNVAVTACETEPPLDQDCGRFTIAVPANFDAFRLRLSGTETQPMLPIIEFGTFSFEEIDMSEPNDTITVDELGELTFPHIGEPVLYATTIEGVDRSGAIGPLIGATLEIRTVVTPDRRPADGIFELSATTDETGAIISVEEGRRGPEGQGIWLHPGEYDVTIVPPQDGEYATGTARVVVDSTDEGDEGDSSFERLAVGPRTLLTGVVVTPEGQPVPQSTIEAFDAGGVSFTTTTDELGYFSLYVDGGFYEVRCIPPDQSLLSWSRLLNVAAFSDLDLDITVGWGTPIEGAVVNGDSGEPIELALLEVFRFEDVLDGDQILVPFARLRTSSDGGFLFLVPPEATPE